jgi:glycine/D-amino acid oxidase-like deaminating enzyme
MKGVCNETISFFTFSRKHTMNGTTSTQNLWAATAPPHPKLSSLVGDQKTDVAIIGGGYTGTSAALHLAEQGVNSILLEANTIGYGGAGRNVGLVNAGLWLMPDDVVSIIGNEYGERLIEVLGASPDLVFNLIEKHNIKCEAVRQGTLHLAHSLSGYKVLQQRESQWKRRNAPVQLLSREETEPMIGSKAFYGALLDKRAGSIQPLAYAFGLAEAARKAGASLYTQSPVTSLKRIGEEWHLKTPGGTVAAKSVILAVQGYADYGFKHYQQALIPFNFFQFATTPLPESVRKTILPGKQASWDTNLVLSSYRLDEAGRLIVGSVGQARNGGYSLHKNWVQRSIKRVFPQVGHVELEFSWDGTIAMTTDHIPRFHVLEKNLVSVTSYNGRGIGPGTVFGKLLAGYIQNGSKKEIPLPVTKSSDVFLRNIRGLFYETGARMYHTIQRRI